MRSNRQTIRKALFIGLLVSLGGCGEGDPGQPSEQPSSLEIGPTKQSACKAAKRDVPGYTQGTVQARITGAGSIAVDHLDAQYNCAAKLALTAAVKGPLPTPTHSSAPNAYELVVSERITNPTEVARCMCPFDLSLEVKGLAWGPYTVIVIDSEGHEVGRTTLSPAKSPTWF